MCGGKRTYSRVKHVGGEENAGNVDDVVSGTANTSGQRTKANGRCLGNDDPRGGGRSESETDGDNQTQRGHRQGGGGGLANGASNTEGNEEGNVDERTPDVDSAAAEVGRKNPGKHDEDGLESGGDETEGEGKLGANTGLCLCVSHRMT